MAGELINKLPDSDAHDFTCCDPLIPLFNWVMPQQLEQVMAVRLFCNHGDQSGFPHDVQWAEDPTTEENELLAEELKRLRRLNPPTHTFQIRRGVPSIEEMQADPRGGCWML